MSQLAPATFIQCNASRLPFADKSVDLVFGSPPYMDARSYGIKAQRGCRDWIDFMLSCTREAIRVSRGLVIWVVGGVTRKKCYWPGCEGLLYRWWEQGGQCWRPAIYHRVGIPGSGGKHWLRADTEYCLVFKDAGYPPWSDNTACGHKPKWAPGGEMSHRLTNGERLDKWGRESTHNGRRQNGERKHTKRIKDTARNNSGGDKIVEQNYQPPVLANPGNVIHCKVGGGLLGHKLAHKNEAPFPEKLAEFFVLGWCPPGGLVLDPFSGSGTTASVAIKNGRSAIAGDIRLSQCQLGRRRCGGVQMVMF